MSQIVINFILKQGLSAAGIFAVSHGLTTNTGWESVAGFVASLVAFIIHWHDTHAAAVASGKITGPVAASGTAVASTVATATAKLVLLLFIPALLFAGCQSTPQKIAYQSAGTTIVSVDAAMSEWGAYVAASHPAIAQEQAVKDAFAKYQAAMAVVCDAGAIYAGASQTNAPAAAGALQMATANLSQEISDLENLIASFGVTLK